jgi:hypothetical protein
LLPADVVDAVGQVSYLAQWLQSLYGRGLAEDREDLFGLPACKAQSYRRMLLKDLDLAVAARGLSNWLIAADPTAADSQSAAEAALTMMEFAVERGEWASVSRSATPTAPTLPATTCGCSLCRSRRHHPGLQGRAASCVRWEASWVPWRWS